MPADPSPPTGTDTWLVIAGGGTGGHVIPGLAVADELVARGHAPASIHWMGSEIGMEVDAVPAAGYELTALPGRGLNARRIDLANLKAAIGIMRASLRGVGLIRRRRPAVLLALGGYASVPGVIGAVLARVPIVVAEQNAVASFANRVAGRFAAVCAVSFDDTDLPKSVVTGNPLRASFAEALATASDPRRRAEVRAGLGIEPNQSLVVAMSGSLGSRKVNTAVIGMVERLHARDDLVVHHVIGRRDWTTEHAPSPSLPAGAAVDYRSVEYEERPDRLLAAADLFVGRAGATTVAELTAIGVPSILVPLPIAPRDAQARNAAPLVAAGAALVLSDQDCKPARLTATIADLLDDATPTGASRLATMAEKARALGRPEAAVRVADLVEEHARG